MSSWSPSPTSGRRGRTATSSPTSSSSTAWAASFNRPARPTGPPSSSAALSASTKRDKWRPSPPLPPSSARSSPARATTWTSRSSRPRRPVKTGAASSCSTTSTPAPLVKRRADAEDLAFGIFPCADGAICFWSGVTRFPRAAELVGRADLLDDPLYAHYEHGGSAESIHHFNNEILLPWLLDRTMDEAWRESQAAGLATAPIFSPGQFFEHPYYRERGFWETISHPAAGDLEYPGAPFRMEATPAKHGRPAPLLGSTTPRSSVASLAAPKPSSARSPLWGSSKPCARRRLKCPLGACACSTSRWSWPAPMPPCCSPIGAPRSSGSIRRRSSSPTPGVRRRGLRRATSIWLRARGTATRATRRSPALGTGTPCSRTTPVISSA